MSKIRNIGIFAHVDAGKTTLTEQILSHAGAIRSTGSVDSGTAHTDTLPVERRRGISVRATCVSFPYKDVQINLIDTPGHVDFSAEIERSLWALDAAVLVVCAVEGVQPQTEVLFNAMQERQMPVIFFLNKSDREGADPNRVLWQIRRMLSGRAVMPNDSDAVAELICESDDELLERYLGGEAFSRDFLDNRLADAVRNGDAYPVLYGSALRNDGIPSLLDAIGRFFPSPCDTGELCGVIFAAQQDRTLGRGVWVRLFGGSLENRDAITLPSGIDPYTGEEKAVQYKITQIHDAGGTPVGRLGAGEIGVVYGLGNAPVGHVLGNSGCLPRRIESGRLRTPLITVRVIPEQPEKMPELRAACQVLSGEDPLLQAQFFTSLNELQLQVMGKIQLEILEELLLTRFDLRVRFSDPAIIYRETISRRSEGFVAYLAPKPCWAVLRFSIEPAPRGSGVTFVSEVSGRELLPRYQHQVEQALPLALRQGRLGWQVTDVKITLTEGQHHLIHTHPLDFIVATPMAVQDGLQRGGSTLLEPILAVRFILSPEHVGRVMSDVVSMRGEVLDSVNDGERVILNALIPVQSSLDYSVTLASATGGRGAMSVRLHGYRECPLELGSTAERKSVDPLDTSKYILAARSALEGGIFDLE
ncbi:MAG: TetM/TetW/TetO/TetS family tetracycline resistance ribosomal protection protein [Ruminococcaceae bacterium]|nr:TetM/TetW/TetO/TetS family tetracycline resistance ribosomal protection protein [Oscillospiraceae bacterium]